MARKADKTMRGHCWWCHEPISMDCPYRGTDPSLTTPGVGVFVCSPACPQRPKGTTVFSRRKE